MSSGSSRISLLVLIGLLAGAASPGVASNPPQGAAPVVSEQVDGLVLDWHAPDPQMQRLNDGNVSISLPGFHNTAGPGEWDVPQTSVLVALPPEDEPVLKILAEQSAPARLPALPLRVPARSAEVEEARLELPLPDVSAAQPVVSFTEIGIMRGVRLGRVTFTPLRETARGWQFTRSVKVRLSFPAAAPSSQYSPEDAWLDQIRRAVVNPGQVQAFFPTPDNPAYSNSGAQTALVSVKDAGITLLTYDALQQAGFPVDSVNPFRLQLTREGAAVAMEWEGDADAVFEPGERLLFYANPRFSRWTDTDVYTLRQEADFGLRITGRSGSPVGLVPGSARRSVQVEKNLLYLPDGNYGSMPAGRDGDRWLWDDLRWPIEKSAQYPFDLYPVDATQTGQVQVYLIGFTAFPANPDHKAVIEVNDVPVGTLEWDGKTAASGSFSIPPNTLRTGQNRLTISLPGPLKATIDGMYLDAFHVMYAAAPSSQEKWPVLIGEPAPRAYTVAMADTTGLRIYDTTRPENPTALHSYAAAAEVVVFGDPGVGDRTYALAAERDLLAPAEIRTAQAMLTAVVTGADYLVITHGDFRPALDPLLHLRASQGLQVAVEDVQSIYDAYGGGRPEPDAIRAYLSDVYARWNPRPRYVLLVGDGTADPRRYYAISSPTFLPPMLADVDPWAGETAADNRYATVHGDDPLPDMAVGRLPANTLFEAQTMVAKIVQNETVPVPGLIHSDLALVADKADGSLRFAAMSDRLIDALPDSIMARRLYFQPVGISEAEKEAERVQMRETILANWNAGASVMVYAGHGSVHQWGEDILFHLNQSRRLNNATRFPLLIELTCLTGAFQSPAFATLDETLLRLPGGGVSAVWGATGLGIATGHEVLAKALLTHVFAADPGRLGDSILAAKLELAQTRPYDIDLVDTYTLLGDPASMITTQAVDRNNLFVPIIRH